MNQQGKPFIEEAAEWAASLSHSDIPPDVLRAGKAQMLSTLAAAIWSTEHPIGEKITVTVSNQIENGSATFLNDIETKPKEAIYGNSALSMALDFDDTVLGGHTGHSTVFTSLAYAEENKLFWRDAAVAHIAANEVSARLASAAAIGPFRGQQTTYIHSVGAAVARGVIEDDDADVIRDAIGISLTQPPWSLEAGFFGGDGKHWIASESIRNGLSAIEAARSGMKGNRGLVEHKDGFLDSFSKISLPEFLEELGDRWHTRAVTVKSVPGCAYVSAPIEAALEISVNESLDAGEIKDIKVHGSLFATEVDKRAAPYLDRDSSPLSALTFTVGYNVAVALIDGSHTPNQLTPKRTKDDEVWSLASKVSLHHDSDFTMNALRSEVPVGAMIKRVGFPIVAYAVKVVGLRAALMHLPTLLRFSRKKPLPVDLSDADKRMGARVEVSLVDGTHHSATVEHPSGFAGHPLDEIVNVSEEKFREAVDASGMGVGFADEVIGSIESLDSSPVSLKGDYI